MTRRVKLNLVVQIAPFGIETVDQIDLLLARPGLDLLLMGNRAINIATRFVVDELIDIVAAGKSRHELFTMLINACLEVTGNANLQHRMPLVRQDIDEIEPVHFSQVPAVTELIFHREER
jgi:hypothetical protein